MSFHFWKSDNFFKKSNNGNCLKIIMTLLAYYWYVPVEIEVIRRKTFSKFESFLENFR